VRKIFGTDGIRGVSNEYPMTIDICLRLAKAIAIKFCNTDGRKHLIIIGKDTRISSDIFEHVLAAAFCSYGIDVNLLGILPTPAISILTSKLHANAGIMISASHNQFFDNGIKIFNNSGLKLKDSEELELEKIMLDDFVSRKPAIGSDIGVIRVKNNATLHYANKIKESFDFSKSDTKRLKIVVDSSNGALSYIAFDIFKNFGFEVISINDSPDGLNINNSCGVMYPETLSKAVLEHDADVGVAFDGDGDRVLLSDENGKSIDGDHILAILVQSENFAPQEIVSTIMSNLAFERYLASNNIKLVRTNVGDRYILEYMQNSTAVIGGEPSGHVIIKSHAPTGDGLFVGLKIIECIIKSKKKLSELNALFQSYQNVSHNVRVRDKSIIENPKITAKIDDLHLKLQGHGRLIVRPSGTEQMVRIYAEGENLSDLEAIVTDLANAIENTA
jgi:phosphoglucosamine mutase